MIFFKSKDYSFNVDVPFTISKALYIVAYFHCLEIMCYNAKSILTKKLKDSSKLFKPFPSSNFKVQTTPSIMGVKGVGPHQRHQLNLNIQSWLLFTRN